MATDSDCPKCGASLAGYHGVQICNICGWRSGAPIESAPEATAAIAPAQEISTMQSSAAFLDNPPDGSDPGWYCLRQDGSLWVRLPDPQDAWTLPHAKQWCAQNGYGF